MPSREVSVELEGHVAAGYELVEREFARNFEERGELGAAFAAVVDGEPVVDLWGGLARRHGEVPWSPDTLVGIFSGTKGLVATCLLLLVERGRLSLRAPVCHYWPEFAARGKERILVGELVSHRAGLPGLLTAVTAEEATDDRRMATLLAAQRPVTGLVGKAVYHAMTFGWLCGELVRRVDGRSIGQFLREEVAAPLDLDVWIGLPADHAPRVAMLELDEAFQRIEHEMELDPAVDELAWSTWANPPRFWAGELVANRPSWHRAEIPATNAIVAARSMARLYACLANGGRIDAVRLLSQETIDAGRRRLAQGRDGYTGAPTAFATGFQVQTSARALGPPDDAFGHDGAGGSSHGAWPRLRTGFSYTPNLLAGEGSPDRRTQALLTALHASVRALRRGSIAAAER